MNRCVLPAIAAAALAGTATADVTDGSFESGGFGSWVTQDLNSPFFPLHVGVAGETPGFGFFTSAPTDGQFAALHGFDGDGASSGFPIMIAQDLTLAAGETQIDFDWRAAWDLASFGATLDRTFRVDIEATGGGASLQSDTILTAQAGTMVLDTGDQLGSIDVSAFAGQSVRLAFYFDVPEDFGGPAFFQLDNVRAVPAPGALALIGLSGLVAIRRRRA